MPTTATRSKFMRNLNQTQRDAQLLRQTSRDDSMRAHQIGFQLLVRQSVEPVQGDPLRSGEIARRRDAAHLGQNVKTHLVCLEGNAVRLALLWPHAGEHLAADLEDVIVAPLDGERR